jgi:hypothetical protein
MSIQPSPWPFVSQVRLRKTILEGSEATDKSAQDDSKYTNWLDSGDAVIQFPNYVLISACSFFLTSIRRVGPLSGIPHENAYRTLKPLGSTYRESISNGLR